MASRTGAFIGNYGGVTPGMTYYASKVVKDRALVNLDSSRAQVFVPGAGLNDFGGAIDPGQMQWLEVTLKKEPEEDSGCPDTSQPRTLERGGTICINLAQFRRKILIRIPSTAEKILTFPVNHINYGRKSRTR